MAKDIFMDFDKKIYMDFDGELKEVIPYIPADNGSSHIDSINFMLKTDYDNIDDIAGHEVCSDELIFLYHLFLSTEDLIEHYDNTE